MTEKSGSGTLVRVTTKLSEEGQENFWLVLIYCMFHLFDLTELLFAFTVIYVPE